MASTPTAEATGPVSAQHARRVRWGGAQPVKKQPHKNGKETTQHSPLEEKNNCNNYNFTNSRQVRETSVRVHVIVVDRQPINVTVTKSFQPARDTQNVRQPAWLQQSRPLERPPSHAWPTYLCSAAKLT